MARTQTRMAKPRPKLDRLTLGLLVAFIIFAAATGITAFVVVRNTIASWTMTPIDNLPSIVDGSQPLPTMMVNGTAVAPTDPLQVSGGPTPTPWDGASRVTVLIMGLDARDWEAGETPRSDSMMLLTLDPLTKTAGMLSIPRDMWVNIPGFDYAKINTAYFLGESQKLPGGGPGLAVKTVEEFLGVPINYYAQVDFEAFVQFINEIDGVKLTIPEDIEIDPIGKDNKVTLKAGTYTVGGEIALAYARARHTEGGDFDRAKRQQQVIIAIRDHIMQLNMMPKLVTKAPALYQELSAGIHTNLTLQQIIQLAWLAKDIDPSTIKKGVIGPPEQVTFAKSPDGLDILIPVPDKIRLLRDEIFTTSGPVSPAASAQGQDAAELMKSENARISLQNGSQSAGLASRTSEYFKQQGLNIAEETNANQLYANSVLVIYNGKPNTISYLAQTMNIPSGRIYNQYDPDSQIDIAVILGTDWASSNPMQ